MRNLYIFSLIALATVIVGLALADEMTFTTYYPAPYGVYNQMSVMSKLGIGTTNPGYLLHLNQSVSGPGATDTPFVISHNSLYDLRVEQAWTSNIDYRFITKLNGTDYNVMTFQNGNVGIGTTNPATRLEVQGGAVKTTGGLIIETRTTDPSTPAVGQMWLRTDINP